MVGVGIERKTERQVPKYTLNNGDFKKMAIMHKGEMWYCWLEEASKEENFYMKMYEEWSGSSTG